MGKPQITVRLSLYLLTELNHYVGQTGMSKTDVVISAIAQYLGCAENVPLIQRVAELEMRVNQLESLMKPAS